MGNRDVIVPDEEDLIFNICSDHTDKTDSFDKIRMKITHTPTGKYVERSGVMRIILKDILLRELFLILNNK